MLSAVSVALPILVVPSFKVMTSPLTAAVPSVLVTLSVTLTAGVESLVKAATDSVGATGAMVSKY